LQLPADLNPQVKQSARRTHHSVSYRHLCGSVASLRHSVNKKPRRQGGGGRFCTRALL